MHVLWRPRGDWHLRNSHRLGVWSRIPNNELIIIASRSAVAMTTVVVQAQFSGRWWVFLYNLRIETHKSIKQFGIRCFKCVFFLFADTSAGHNSEQKSDVSRLPCFFLQTDMQQISIQSTHLILSSVFLVSDMSADFTSEQQSNVSSVLFLHADFKCVCMWADSVQNTSPLFYGFWQARDYRATIMAAYVQWFPCFPPDPKSS